MDEGEVIIRCGRVDETIERIHRQILSVAGTGPKVVFYKDGGEYYFPIEDVLFFETENDAVFAHTERDSYRIRFKLYELEQLLTRQFMRCSKSAVVNTKKIYAIKRDISQTGQLSFAHTHKKVYASRHYYKALKERIEEGFHERM
jgi:DNA-binding LytR/AlgR family response regulator